MLALGLRAPALADLWSHELVSIGQRSLTVGVVVLFSVYLIALALIAQLVRRRLVFRVLRRTRVDEGVQYATARIVSYLIWILGLLAALPQLGLDFDSLLVTFGALSVGIGLGLQGLANNMVSGVVLLFERPVKVGDRVQLDDGIQGQVIAIQARTTILRTNENVNVLVPNSEFVGQRITNLSHQGHLVKFRFPIGVSYSSDVERVRETLLRVGRASPRLAAGHEPEVLFLGCGDSSLEFVLRVPSDTMLHLPEVFATEIYFGIWSEFAREGIEIPFPQRDLHLRSATPLQVHWSPGQPLQEIP